MKNIRIFAFLISIFIASCTDQQPQKGQVKIEWAETLAGDYSFQNEWSYAEGVYRNQFGQLSCDGLCPPEIDAMKDSTGRIISDSLKSFYHYVDTTHLVHAIKCSAWCYEWAGTDFIEVKKINKDSVHFETGTNAATHCSLHMNIVGDICTPKIELNSIMPNASATYHCSSGWIKMGKLLWKKDIVKAEFFFIFDHKEDPKQVMYWKGKIFTTIKTKK